MAKFSSILNFLTVIFVSYGPFVNSDETTLEERKDALSTLFGELDKYVPDSNKIQASFDDCCNKCGDNLDENSLYECVEQYFSKCARGLQTNVQDFTGPDKGENRQKLKGALTAYEKALNDDATGKTTHMVNALLLDRVQAWQTELNGQNPTFYNNAARLTG